MQIKRWLSLEINDSTWIVDVQFMLSGYSCTFGSGCPGIQGDPDVGCCAIGTPLYKDEEDTVAKRVAQLTPEDWQFYGHKWRKRVKRKSLGSRYNTAIHSHNGREGCIFANRGDFHSGAGCAFHAAALRRGEKPIDWKPFTCWAVPMGVSEIPSMNTYVVRMIDRAEWTNGIPDYDVVGWWCSDDNVSWASPNPVFMSHSEEWKRIISDIDADAWPIIRYALEEIWLEAPKTIPEAVPVTLYSRNPKDY